MTSGWRYRVASVVGTALLTATAIAVVNEPVVQNAFANVPYFGRPAPFVLSDSALLLAISTAVVVVTASMWHLFKPRPRRILDTLMETQRRVLLAMVGLAALGYFNYSYRLPRSTLMLATVVLLVVLPPYMVAIRRRPKSTKRTVLIGDDPVAMRDTIAVSDATVLGYVAPSTMEVLESDGGADADVDGKADDPVGIKRLGGLSRIEEVIVSNDVDTVLLAFHSTDRAEFFGALAACYDHGVNALVHRDHVDHVLTDDVAGGDLMAVDLEPWDWQDYLVKRVFDVAFASLALLVLAPIIILLTILIKLDSPGPVLYSQDRTAEFGDTFRIYKFRSMIPEAESDTGARLSDEDAGGVDPRVTRVGKVLRRTHLDEIPQLWSILVGDMSVVGPRPERPELDLTIEEGVGNWRRRWFVKPGLTGLAQIRGATGHEPEVKLRHDIEYIRRQSFWFDLKIVVRQLWQVAGDVLTFLHHTGEPDSHDRSEASGSDSVATAYEGDASDSLATDGSHPVAAREAGSEPEAQPRDQTGEQDE